MTLWDSSPLLIYDFACRSDQTERMIFSHPAKIIEARHIHEVIPAIRKVQRGIRSGYYAAGYIAYEAASAFDPALETHRLEEDDLPLVWFGLFTKPDSNRIVPVEGELGQIRWQPSIKQDEYESCIQRIREAISRGETYQVNYTMRLRAMFEHDDLLFYHHLLEAQQSKYAAYLNIGRFRILSASPELFFQKEGNRLTVRPMKGTVPRGRYEEEDLSQREWLANSQKNQAENVMIVDLLRNDLGRIAETGSVRTCRLFEIETYPTVHQMTSTITANIPSDVLLEDLLTMLFPCGSITGAPKVSTMDWIKKLEDSPRRIYCGTIGLIKPNGEWVFNVAIRTVLLDKETGIAEYGVGGGITYDSTAAGEYHEAMAKAAVLTEKQPEFSLLETLRLEKGSYDLLERHLQRLESSARYFRIPVSMKEVREELYKHAGHYQNETRRVRLLLSQQGNIHIESTELAAWPARSLPVSIASVPIDKSDRFLFHKTTYRQMYEERRKCHTDVFDVLLLNEEGEVTEFTIGNIVAEIGGKKWTPPRNCGLLAGTFREELLSQGEIHEAILRPEDLKRATGIWLINSVRGWVPVHLV